MGEFIDETNQEVFEFLHIGGELRTHHDSNTDDSNWVDAKQRFRNLHDLRATRYRVWGFKDPTLIDYLAVDDSLQESVVRYVVPERATAAIEDLDDSLLWPNLVPLA